MEVVVGTPEWLYQTGILTDGEDVRVFFRRLFQTLDARGLKYEKLTKAPSEITEAELSPDKLYLLFHTMFDKSNVWNIMRSHSHGYFYFDKMGYAGWSEMAQRDEPFEKAMSVSQSDANEFFDEYARDYIQNNKSKWTQHDKPLEVDGPYVFVAGQLPTDTVSKLAYVGTLELMMILADAYEGTGTKVVMKIHPWDNRNCPYRAAYEYMRGHPNVIVTDASIHAIIPNSECVYMCNSGVGFETLLHLKPLVLTGGCDYSRVCHVAKNEDELLATVGNPPVVDVDMVKRFVYYSLKTYFVGMNDQDGLEAKIDAAIEMFNAD
jgi:hypothetical protein